MSISEEPDFSQLDDSTLISTREQMRGELERLPRSRDHAELAARYDLTTAELNGRARAAWSRPATGAPPDPDGAPVGHGGF